MKNILLSFLLIFICQNLQSQIYFKNNYNKPVFVAVGYYRDWEEFKGWVTSGWFYVLPNEKKEVLSYNPMNENIYYYAETKGAEKVFEGDSPLLIHPVSEFTIINADKDYVKDENPTYNWAKFRELKKGSLDVLKSKYTIEFSY